MRYLMKSWHVGCVLSSGVDIIYERFEEMGISQTVIDSKKYIKRIDKALIKYIKERFEAMLWDVRYEKSIAK